MPGGEADPGPSQTGVNNPSDWQEVGRNALNDLFRTPGAVSWWHKTVGTMGDLARTSPKFKRTYDAIRRKPCKA
jgi:hypothetical protein